MLFVCNNSNLYKKIVVGLIFGIFCELNLLAGDFELGFEAYNKGDW